MSKDSVTVTQAATPEQIAMARECAARAHEQAGLPITARSIRNGEFDNGYPVQAALAAIIETTERAANLADDHARHAWDIGTMEGQNHVCSSGRNHGARHIATSLRNGAHLKGPDQ